MSESTLVLALSVATATVLWVVDHNIHPATNMLLIFFYTAVVRAVQYAAQKVKQHREPKPVAEATEL